MTFHQRTALVLTANLLASVAGFGCSGEDPAGGTASTGTSQGGGGSGGTTASTTTTTTTTATGGGGAGGEGASGGEGGGGGGEDGGGGAGGAGGGGGGEGGEGGGGTVCEPGATEDCYTGPDGTQGVGLCKAGTSTCLDDGSGFGPCEGDVTPVAETCETPEDDDCDGQANEDGEGCTCVPGSSAPCYTGPAGTEGVGPCAAGTQTCNDAGTGYGACSGEVTPAPETCATAEDDDCDGMVNEDGEGCACVPGSAAPCYTGPAGTEGVGVCKGGAKTCNDLGTEYGPCMGEVAPAPETCATPEDDDCDGAVNEEGEGCVCVPGSAADCYTGPAGTEGQGLCKGGTKTCNDLGTEHGPCMGEVTPALETCGTPEDDDCDGAVNEEGEGCVCVPGSVAPCYSGPAGTEGKGICKAGTQTCNELGTAYGACVGEVLPKPELCGTPADDDCSGAANEICGPPTGYKLSHVPNCGTYCYFDEPHNIAINGAGQGSNNNGFDKYALGQLLDGKKGADKWPANLGNGNAYEWVGWSDKNVDVTFQFAAVRDFESITIGINNWDPPDVTEPKEVQVRFSPDDQVYGGPIVFKKSDASLPIIPNGKRGDVTLAAKGTGKFVRLTFVYAPQWTFIDEVSFK